MVSQILILVILILLNGFFSASEIAFLSFNKMKLKKQVKLNNKKAIKVKKLLDNTSSFLATIQIGITLAGFLASAFAAEAFADAIVVNLTSINIPAGVLKTIVVIIVTMILSYFTLVFGELIPKKLALYYPEKIAYFSVGIIAILMKITYPFVWLLTKSTNLFTSLIGIKDKKEEILTEEEIKMIISDGKEMGTIEPAEKDLIFNIFDFNDTEIKDIMREKQKVISIDVNISKKDLVETLKSEKYTRIPVYEDSKDNIIGILNVKDLISYTAKDDKFEISKIVRTPYFVEQNEKVDDVFRQMQKKRQCMGIVTENKKFIGIVTTEDAIEEIVGNLFDEYD